MQQEQFDKSRSAWIDVIVFDTMRVCLAINANRDSSIFLHQDLHTNNVAVTAQFRGALADFGRSTFVQKVEPMEFIKELEKAAFQNGALREEMETLVIYNNLEK